jgi:Glycosyl transferase family 2
MPDRTILSVFHNEAYLLEPWLQHHRTIFDHGILLDNGSTDHSREVIARICPSWEVRPTRVLNQYSEWEIHKEIQAITDSITGWRMVLNVTEFLMGDYRYLRPGEGEIIPATWLFVDMEDGTDLDPDLPIYEQFAWGCRPGWTGNDRTGRILHDQPITYRWPGRHYEGPYHDFLAIFYYGWAPKNDTTIARHLQFNRRMTPNDLAQGWNHHMMQTKQQVLDGWHNRRCVAEDIMPWCHKFIQWHRFYNREGIMPNSPLGN